MALSRLRPASPVLALWVLLSACSTNLDGDGKTPDAVAGPSEEEVEDFITNGPLDLAPDSTIGGAGIATEDDLADLGWGDLADIPADLADGDDDTLGVLLCGEGEWISVVGGSWTCTAWMPPERIDTTSGTTGDVLVVTSTGAAWTPLEAVLPATGCPAGMVQTGDTCVESSARSEGTWQDAVVACAAAGAHLCFHSELVPGCVSGAFTPAPNSSELEWAADRTANGQAAVAFGPLYDCEASAASIGQAKNFRCCTAAR